MLKRVGLLTVWMLFLLPVVVSAAHDRVALPLTTEPVQLIGPKSEAVLYYEIEGKAERATLQLVVSHSTLLREPSAFTVEIDGVLKETFSITRKDEPVGTVEIPLSSRERASGTHTVRITFDGYIAEGMCVDQRMSGNWLSIHLQSHVELLQYERHYDETFAHFTDDFKGIYGEETTIVIPERASATTRSTAIRLRAHLANASERAAAITIEERPVNGTKTVYVGERDAFEEERIRQLEVKEDALALGKFNSTTAYIVAEKEETIEQYIAILFRPEWARQLGRKHLDIRQLPDERMQSIYTLHQLNIAPIQLHAMTPKSSEYYVPLPYALQPDESTVFHFELRKTSLLQFDEQGGREAELLLIVNGETWPIDLYDLVDEETHYTLDVPVSNDVLMRDSAFTFQIVANGFGRHDPCIATDETDWVEIDPTQSSIQFSSVTRDETNIQFSNLPFPFAFEPTLLLVPTWDTVGDAVYDELIRRFHLNQTPFIIRTYEDVTEEERANAHLIAINAPDSLSSTLQRHEDGTMMLGQYGVVEGTEDVIFSLEPNPWNAQREALFVTTVQETLDSPHSFRQLFETKRASQFAVYNTAGQLVFDRSNVDSSTDTVVERQQQDVIWLIVGFVALLLAIILLLVVLTRARRKRNGPTQ